MVFQKRTAKENQYNHAFSHNKKILFWKCNTETSINNNLSRVQVNQ